MVETTIVRGSLVAFMEYPPVSGVADNSVSARDTRTPPSGGELPPCESGGHGNRAVVFPGRRRAAHLPGIFFFSGIPLEPDVA
jgi:hypothetical protein